MTADTRRQPVAPEQPRRVDRKRPAAPPSVFDAPAPRVPSPDALAAAETVASRVRDRDAQVRRLFIERDDIGTTPPLALMLRGGRGGSVRLRLYLSLLWFAANPPYDVTYPSRAWAVLLDLADPDAAGARRVAAAFTWLAEHRFIESVPRPGQPSEITLLNESGSGAAYSVPGAAWRTLKDGDVLRAKHRYVRLPSEFWTSGHMAVLSGPAVAMYLILLTEVRQGDVAKQKLWIAPSVADNRFALSEDTRSSGLRELVRSGLVRVERQTVRPSAFDFHRQRNVYRLRPARLDKPARVPAQ